MQREQATDLPLSAMRLVGSLLSLGGALMLVVRAILWLQSLRKDVTPEAGLGEAVMIPGICLVLGLLLLGVLRIIRHLEAIELAARALDIRSQANEMSGQE